MATLHPVSDVLADRHPYLPQAHAAIFSPEVNAHEVMMGYGRRGLDKLADVLRSDVTTDKEQCEALILILNELSSQEKKMQAIRGGVTVAATNLLHSTSPGVRGNAALVLSRLALLLQGREALRDAGSVPQLCVVCGDADATVRQAAAEALTCLAYFRDGWDILVRTRGAVKELVDCLAADPCLAATFVNITAFHADGCKLALSSNIMTYVHALIRDPPSTAVLNHVLLTVRHLVMHEIGKEAAIKAELIVPMVAHLEHDNLRVKVNLTGALGVLCIALEAKTQFQACGGFAVTQLARLLNDDSKDVQANTRVAIRMLSELPALKDSFVGALLVDLELLKLFGPSAAGPVVQFLADPDASTRALATAAAHSLASSADGCDALIHSLHCVARLMAMLGDPAAEADTVKHAALTLRSLCTRYPDAKRTARAALAADDAGAIKPRLALHSDLATLLVE